MVTKVSPALLANTSVSTGTYGGPSQQAVFVVDQQGRVTSAANATPSIATTQLTGTITNAQLAGSITSDKISSVSNTAISGFVMPNQLANNATYGITAQNYAGLPSGTVLLFKQTTAPTGWTKLTDASLDDAALRVVTGSAGTGGSSAFTTVFANQTPSISSSLSVGSTTLSTSQMPSHNHTPNIGNAGGNFGNDTANWVTNSAGQQYTTGPGLNSTGGGGSHNHGLSGSITSSAITLNVKYVDLIAASKN